MTDEETPAAFAAGVLFFAVTHVDDISLWEHLLMEFPEGLQSMDETICPEHINDEYLKKIAGEHVDSASCSFCRRKPINGRPFAAPMDVIVAPIFEAIHASYGDITAAPWAGVGSDLPPGTGEVVLAVTQDDFDEFVLEAVVEAIAGAIATPTHWYKRDNRGHFSYSWGRFAETVRNESRFVFIAQPRTGGENEPPARLAGFLEGLLTYARKSTGMLHPLPKGTRLYRGRMTDDALKLQRDAEGAPAKVLGAAPPEKAAAGRMSGEGVPLFYAATTVKTAVAEIALHSPYDHAVIGEFITEKVLTVLDFTATPKLPSRYDAERQTQRMFGEFVGEFVDAITRPVILDGRERVDYIPTQVVTEYLRWVPERRIDGIAFRARADNSGKNVVLFTASGDVQDNPRTATGRDPMLSISRNGISAHSAARYVEVRSR